jgi:hypothetical protein
MLMCIAHVQCRSPPVLPVLQEMQPTPRRTIGECAVYACCARVKRFEGTGRQQERKLLDTCDKCGAHNRLPRHSRLGVLCHAVCTVHVHVALAEPDSAATSSQQSQQQRKCDGSCAYHTVIVTHPPSCALTVPLCIFVFSNVQAAGAATSAMTLLRRQGQQQEMRRVLELTLPCTNPLSRALVLTLCFYLV